MITVELIPAPDEGGYTARLPDIPAYGEGETEDAAIADLKEALRGYIETFGPDDALARISSPSAIRQMNWNLTELAHG
ncbi:MAG: type II toxin-antitoxin system HicB family antitoxin [Planctomycetota bacterium]|nr:type II toxin-antitoxin system HicB family antitoxin [Planctomycetota bacterium]